MPYASVDEFWREHDRRDRMLNLYEQGASARGIALSLKITRHKVVVDELRRLNLPMQRTPRALAKRLKAARAR